MEYRKKLDDIEARFEDLERQMADPAVIADADGYRKVARARSEIEPLVTKFREYKQVLHNLEDARPMLTEADPELQNMARDEVARLEPELTRIEQ